MLLEFKFYVKTLCMLLNNFWDSENFLLLIYYFVRELDHSDFLDDNRIKICEILPSNG